MKRDIDYLDGEFDKVCGGEYKLKITSAGGATHWLNIDSDEVDNIHAMLAGEEEN